MCLQVLGSQTMSNARPLLSLPSLSTHVPGSPVICPKGIQIVTHEEAIYASFLLHQFGALISVYLDPNSDHPLFLNVVNVVKDHITISQSREPVYTCMSTSHT